MDRSLRSKVSELRANLRHGENATQDQLDHLCRAWEERINPSGTDRETLILVDSHGNASAPALEAPRWLCHLLGLRHKCAHVVLRWHSPGLGPAYVLQVRGWDKDCLPGHLDTTVGGHIIGEAPSQQAAFQEMKEEIGIVEEQLVGQALTFVGGYATHDEHRDNFCDAEWHDVYLAEIAGLDAIRFEDREVVGVYVCPASEVRNLMTQPFIPVTGILRLVLQRCLELEL